MISDGVILEPRSDFYIIDVDNLIEGTGRIIQYVFDGYLINVQDSNNNNKISNHKVDKTGKEISKISCSEFWRGKTSYKSS